ncbi:hypothetical protein ABPG73_022841 [Tetrahymena malaccensis]
MYCFKNINDYYLVGQFEMNEFSVIQINIIPCDQSDPNNKVQCMEESKKNQILSNSQLQVYYINQVVQVNSQEQPFKPMGITYFWESNIDFLQNINLMFMKTYVQDDIGVIFGDYVQSSSLLFSRERTTMSSKKDLSIYQLSLYLEKNKEQTYSRNYQRIFDCFSSIGGIYNVLFALGCIIAQPYSQIQLNRKLFNSTFQINQNDEDQQLNESQTTKKSNSKKNKDKNAETEIQNDLKDNRNKFQTENLEKANQFFEGSQIDQIVENKENNKSILNVFKQQFTSNYEKAKQAQLAFNNIYRNQQKQSKIDMKLIQLLNQDLIELFDNNVFQHNNLAGSIYLFNQSLSKARQKTDSFQSPILNYGDRFSKQFSFKNFNKFSKTLNFSQELKDKKYCEEDLFESNQNSQIIEIDSILHNYQPQRKHFMSYTQQRNKVYLNDFQLKKQQSENDSIN